MDDLSRAKEAIVYFNKFVSACDVSPLEMLVWCALFEACKKAQSEGDMILTVSITNLTEIVSLHREQIRRALNKLRSKRLARNVGSQWIYLLDGLS
jgi:hypothetical protein